jgi:hypothetical protein
MVTAGGVLKVIIEDPGLPIAKGDFNVGRTPLNGGIPFLDDQPRSPLGISAVNNPISDLQIQRPYFFHYFFITKSFSEGKPKDLRPYPLEPASFSCSWPFSLLSLSGRSGFGFPARISSTAGARTGRGANVPE